MTTTDDERHCRICLMLMNGGTKISEALFEKCMKGQTPENHIPHPWTLDHFLRANKTKILGTQIGKVKKNIIFSAQGSSTHVEEWDLSMYFFFLIEIVDVECRLRMDIKQLRKIRNKICHLNEPKIGIEKYNRTVDKLGVIYERLLKEICDEELTNEVNRILKSSKEDPLSINETKFVLHKIFKTDFETREILTQQNAELSSDVKTLMEKVDEIKKKLDLMLSNGLVDGEFENCTETCLELRIKNCPSCKERSISNALVSMYKKVTGQSSNEQTNSSDMSEELMAAVKETMVSFASKKRAIIDAEQNCVILLIKCSTVNSLLSLFYDCINGDLNKEFQKLESAVRQIKGLEEASLEAVLYMDEFYSTMQRTVSALDEYVTRAYGKHLQNRGQGQTENTYGITNVRLVERLLPDSDDKRQSQHAVRITIKTDADRKTQLMDPMQSGSFDSSFSRLKEEICKHFNLTNFSIEAKLVEEECGLFEDDCTVEDDQRVGDDHRVEKINSDELDRILDEVNTVEDKHIVGDCNIFEDDHIDGDNISAKDDLSDNCNESKDEDLLSNKSEVHSSPYLSGSECKQAFEHGETGVSNRNSSLKTDQTSEAETQLKCTTKMDQQADNKIEEDLCEMGENILDHKQLSEEKTVSHSPLYLHSQPKVKIDSEIFTHPVRMSPSTDSRRHASVLLSEVLDDIGINERMIMRARKVFMLMETMNNITLKSVGHNRVSYILGSRCEGTTTLGLMSDIDQLLCIGYYNVIQDWSEWEHGKENYFMIQDENTTPGYCFLMLLQHDKPLPATFIPNKYHITDKKGRILLKDTMIGDIYKYGTRNRPAFAIQKQQGHSATDIIVGLPCESWPKSAASGWLVRQGIGKWPTQEMRRYAVSLGCSVVPTGSKVSLYPELEWRISTPLAERFLMSNLNITQIRCYVLMKMVLKTFLNPQGEINISNFMCKTVLLRCIQNKEPGLWKADNLLECLRYCLTELLICVQKNHLPHFIIPYNNLFAGQFTIETKHQLLKNISDVIQNDIQSLLNIDIDNLGLRLQVKLGLVRRQYNLSSSLDICEYMSARCNLSFSMNTSKTHLCLLKSLHSKDIGIMRQTVERLMTYNNNDYKLEHAAFTFLAPLLFSNYGSALASASLGLKHKFSPQALVWLQNGFESDISSGRLKFASVFYSTGDMATTDLILRHTESQYYSYTVVPICGCSDSMLLPIVTAGFARECNENILDCVKINTAFCVRFLRQEINCVPCELQYEMFRSTLDDLLYRNQDEDFWMDFAVVDSLVLLYFLQYKVYRHLQRYQDQQQALSKLVHTIKTDKTLRHKETALNVLGQCMEQENRPKQAFQCYQLSLQQRARNNVAKIHMCRLLSSLLVGKDN